MTSFGDSHLVYSELPPYEPPPDWVPPRDRNNHPDYYNDLTNFLPREVHLTRSRTFDVLGFNIRGGADHACGIFISKVLQDSEAEYMGLREGDQILEVNGESFEDIPHSQAVRSLKSNTDIHLIVCYFPYGYQKSYEKTKWLTSVHQSPSLHWDGPSMTT